MPNTIVPFPSPDADEHARGETERKRRLFAWADSVLQQLSLTDRVAQTNNKEELRKITFDPEAVEVELAIRDALYPAVDRRRIVSLGCARAPSNEFSAIASTN